jgi:hypothetical protein
MLIQIRPILGFSSHVLALVGVTRWFKGLLPWVRCFWGVPDTALCPALYASLATSDFKPMPTKNVSDDLSRLDLGLRDLTTLKVCLNNLTKGS